MENNKYYVPEIEEFRVGFEYEHLYGNHPNPDFAGKWISQIVGNRYRIECFGDYIKERRIRVKYLDTTDIEELEFTLKHKAVDLWFEKEGTFESPAKEAYLYSKIFINYGLHDRYCKITAKYASDNDEVELFRGTILNKSELKWILTRIGVL